MAYVSTVDERYVGGLFPFGADAYDASNLLNSNFVLAQDQPAYGNLTDIYSTPDIDTYSLGVLSTGFYALDVDDWTWDFTSNSFGFISRFELLNSSGLVVATSFSTFTDITFSVVSPETFYVRIVGSASFEQQYRASYTKTGELNTAAVWDSTAYYTGNVYAGETIDATVSVFDADGNSDGVVLTRWYLDGVDQGYTEAFALSSSDVGKILAVSFALIDDLGNAEASPLYSLGEVEYGAEITSTSSFALPELPQVFSLKLLGNLNVYGHGNSNSNTISGNTGSNSLRGNGGNDTLNGGAGDDTLDGGPGLDRLLGGAGNDTYNVSSGDTLVEGIGQGTDLVRSSGSFTLANNFENLTLFGSSASSGTGNSSNNSILGNPANNVLRGLNGADILSGGNGNDSLSGGLGNDRLTGGLGSDTFVFDTSLAQNIDRITDFNVVSDTIRLENAVFVGLANGALTAARFVANTSGNAADALDRIIYETDTGKLFFDQDGSGAITKVQFATLTPNLLISQADFLVF